MLPALPDSSQASEDEHFFELRCMRCGWTATFSATDVRAEEIASAALAHQCPRPKVGVRLCVRCKREIGELASACPYCGAENPLLPE